MNKDPLPPKVLSDRFLRGLGLALSLHRLQARKGTTVPYMAHLMGVASLVLEGHGNEDEAIAGLLHDAKEDAGGASVVDHIRADFGDTVAEIVEGCSERYAEPKLPWLTRKLEYIARLSSESASVHLVSSADKLHNVRSLLADHQALGDEIWDRFTVSREGTIWYYRSLADAYIGGPSPLAPLLKDAVSTLEHRAGICGRGIEPSVTWEST